MEISDTTKKYWEEQDWKDLEEAKSFKDLFVIAKRVIYRMPHPLVQVCGPIATGGLGSIEANLNAFNETIKELQAEGKSVFDQMPFEDPMQKLKTMIENKDYMNTIFTDFYYPIFDSGLISELYFMPNWNTSVGATKEHDKAKESGIKIVYL